MNLSYTDPILILEFIAGNGFESIFKIFNLGLLKSYSMRQAHRQTTETQNNGTVYMAYTDAYHEVAVWRPGITATSNNTPLNKSIHNTLTQTAHHLMGNFTNSSDNYRGEVFCHGHSLGTFSEYGYCVLGGTPMETVLTDEYDEVDMSDVRAGDIIVWRKLIKTKMQIVHSALVEIVAGSRSAKEIKLSSKDTFSGYSHEFLSKYLKTWGNKYKFYRKK